MKYEIGQVYEFRLEELKPTQKDDGRRNASGRPVAVAIDRGNLLVIEGNHRYYDALESGLISILGKVIENPYECW